VFVCLRPSSNFFVFCAVRVVSKGSGSLVLPRTCLFLGWGETESLGTYSASGPIKPTLDIKRKKCNIWWYEHCQEKQKYSEKPAPLQLYPPQIPHEAAWNWTRATARNLLSNDMATQAAILWRAAGSLRGCKASADQTGHSSCLKPTWSCGIFGGQSKTGAPCQFSCRWLHHIH
jgi:hypothetical protein